MVVPPAPSGTAANGTLADLVCCVYPSPFQTMLADGSNLETYGPHIRTGDWDIQVQGDTPSDCRELDGWWRSTESGHHQPWWSKQGNIQLRKKTRRFESEVVLLSQRMTHAHELISPVVTWTPWPANILLTWYPPRFMSSRRRKLACRPLNARLRGWNRDGKFHVYAWSIK